MTYNSRLDCGTTGTQGPVKQDTAPNSWRGPDRCSDLRQGSITAAEAEGDSKQNVSSKV